MLHKLKPESLTNEVTLDFPLANAHIVVEPQKFRLVEGDANVPRSPLVGLVGLPPKSGVEQTLGRGPVPKVGSLRFKARRPEKRDVREICKKRVEKMINVFFLRICYCQEWFAAPPGILLLCQRRPSTFPGSRSNRVPH